MVLNAKQRDKFWSYVNKTDNCWLWTRAISSRGYGTFSANYATLAAHRVAYILTKGSVDGLVVCHTCDNKICVNPDHLFLGTQKDNMRDRDEKHRQAVGSKHGKAFLNESKARAIKSSKEPNRKLATKYKVHIVTIRNIKNGKTWRHV